MGRNNNLAQGFEMKIILKLMILIVGVSSLSGCSSRVLKQKHHKKENLIEANQPLSKSDAKTTSISQMIEEISSASNSSTSSGLANKYILKPDQLINLSVSKNGYTRLFMEDERITDVFVYPQEAVQVRIHNQGYLIIVPGLDTEVINASEGKVYLTLTGEKGTTQDLSLRFTGKNPEPVNFVKLDLGNNSSKKGD